MNPEQFYKDSNYPELDKHDKKANKFSYYDLLDFADAYYKLNNEAIEDLKELAYDTCPLDRREDLSEIINRIKLNK